MGNTAPGPGQRSLCGNHPHVRGEYAQNSLHAIRKGGSPPPAWGIQSRVSGSAPEARIPSHMRGEYRCCSHAARPFLGSPPHAWGIQSGLIGMKHVTGHTPTCVGNTTMPYSVSRFLPGSSPHAWGMLFTVSCFSALFRNTPTGSPPRAWGIHPQDRYEGFYEGITPHMRGEYLSSRCRPPLQSDSPPRAWGMPRIMISNSIEGLPPRVWGILIIIMPVWTRIRITPTCVGKLELIR